MKTKLSRILGVALTTVLLVSLMAFAVPTPVSANPGAVAWERLPIPTAAPGPTQVLTTATLVGPLAYQPLDGSLYAYCNAPGPSVLLKSADGGHTFAPTGFAPAVVLLAIVTSPVDANVVYVATTTTVYKSTNGGASFVTVATNITFPAANAGDLIVSLDVAYYGGRYLVAVGTDDTGIPASADVLVLDEAAPFSPWASMGFNARMLAVFALALDTVPAVAFCPDQTSGLSVVALGADNTGATGTAISIKVGGADWGGTFGNLAAIIATATTTAADITFPDGFTLATGSGCYFGINDAAAGVQGVYAFTLATVPAPSLASARLLGPNICSIDTTGAFFSGPIVAGTQNDVAAFGAVVRSLDGGFTWPPVAKGPVNYYAPSTTYVEMAVDFAAAGRAWALVQGNFAYDESGLFITLDSATSFNGECLIKTDVGTIQDLTFTPTGDTFMSTAGGGDSFSITAAAAANAATVVETAGVDKANVMVLIDLDGDTTIVYAAGTWTITFGDAGDSVIVFCAASPSNVTWTQTVGLPTALEVTDLDADQVVAASGVAFNMPDAGAANDSIWRFDGAYWERVSSQIGYGTPPIAAFAGFNLVEASPAGDAVFLANLGNTYVIKSINRGQTWAVLPTPTGGSIPAADPVLNWVIINSTTIMTGGVAKVCLTVNNGLTWSEPVVPGANFVSFDVVGTSILAGDNAGNVFLSLDGGATWIPQGASGAAGNTFVAFDGANPAVMYAVGAGGPGVFRKLSPAPTDVWLRIDLQGQTNVGPVNEFPSVAGVGIESSANGALYVADPTAVGATATAGGLRRALDPTAPIIPAPVSTPYWETGNETIPVPTALPATFVFANLWLAGGNLWTVCNVAGPTTFGVWFYTDTLDASPSLALGNVTTTTATFAWDVPGIGFGSGSSATAGWSALAGAWDYQLQVNSRADWNPATFISTIVYFPDTTGAVGIAPAGVVGGAPGAAVAALLPGTTYYARVRVGVEFGVVIAAPVTSWGNGAPVRSRWSNTLTLVTPLGEATPPIPLSPLPGAQNVIVNPTFDWDPVVGATSYNIVVATNEALTAVVASGSPTTDFWACPVTLEYDTTYYWSITPVGAAPDANTIYSIFHTEMGPAAAVYTCGICGLQYSSQAALEAHIASAHAAPVEATPMYIWFIIGIGAVLVIAVVVLIVRTRTP